MKTETDSRYFKNLTISVNMTLTMTVLMGLVGPIRKNQVECLLFVTMFALICGSELSYLAKEDWAKYQ